MQQHGGAKVETQHIKLQLHDLLQALFQKDIYTLGHAYRVAGYARTLAARLGLTQTEQNEIYYMALLHDVGKLEVPTALLHKNTALTESELRTMHGHTALGEQILRTTPGLACYAPGARWHHEWFDGSGYPDGLRGAQVPLTVRIIAVADAYDAMTSARVYQNVLPQQKVKAEMQRSRSVQFDPQVADAMLALIDEDKEYRMRCEK